MAFRLLTGVAFDTVASAEIGLSVRTRFVDLWVQIYGAMNATNAAVVRAASITIVWTHS